MHEIMSMTLAQKRKFVKDLLKKTTDKVVKAIDGAPAEWDEIELQAYIAEQFKDENVTFALRGNTARGRAFNAELLYNRAL